MKGQASAQAQKYTSLKMADLELNDGQLEGLPRNPRTIDKWKFEKLKNDIIEYPEMLEYRSLLVYPLDNGKYIIIAGNMRYRAMTEIGFDEVPCVVIPKDTMIERLQAYTILDNNGFGDWDWDLLANDWDAEKLKDWGMDFPDDWVDGASDEVEDDEPYSKKVVPPTYTPSERCPEMAEMYNTSKRDRLVKEIENSSVSGEVKEFLIRAAERHVTFDYGKIADFYAHSSAEVQDLMEKSALVIIDFDKAIEYGFVVMTKDLANAYRKERGLTEDAELTEQDIYDAYDEE